MRRPTLPKLRDETSIYTVEKLDLRSSLSLAIHKILPFGKKFSNPGCKPIIHKHWMIS